MVGEGVARYQRTLGRGRRSVTPAARAVGVVLVIAADVVTTGQLPVRPPGR